MCNFFSIIIHYTDRYPFAFFIYLFSIGFPFHIPCKYLWIWNSFFVNLFFYFLVSGSNWYIWRVSSFLQADVLRIQNVSLPCFLFCSAISFYSNEVTRLSGAVQVLQLKLYQNNLKGRGCWRGIGWWMLLWKRKWKKFMHYQ